MSRRKILILGSSGGLGSSLAGKFISSGYNILMVNRKIADVEKNFNKVENLIRKFCPKYIINCIAKTGTKPCEDNPVQAFNVNTLFPYKVAKVAKKINSKMIHFSTDAIFKGNKYKKIYRESDMPHPTTTYGQTKLYGEILSKQYMNILVIRLPILFGLTQKNQIIDRLVSRLLRGKKIKASSDILSTPTYNMDVVNFILNLIDQNKYDFFVKRCDGTIHLSSGVYISLLNFMKIIGKKMKKNKLIKSAKESDFNSTFIKPQYLGLKSIYQRDIRRLHKFSLKSKIDEYIKQLND